MAHIFADRVADTTQTTGTGAYTLDAPSLNGFENIRDVCANGDTIYLSVSHRTLNQWENGKYTFGSGTNALTRTQILSSSNGDAAVNFSSGTKDIVAGLPASVASVLAIIGNIATDRLVGRDTAGTGAPEEITVGGGIEFTGSGGIQRSALTGDVTASAGSNATTIANDAVTFAKMQNIATDRLIGRDTAASGDPEEISLVAPLEFNGSQGVRVADNGISNTLLRDSGALSVIGRSANSSGDPADISATPASDAVLRESGGVLGFGTIATGGIADDAVTFAKLQNIVTDSLIGRDTAGTGDPENITLNGTLEMTGAGALQRAALTGDVTAPAGSNSTTIANNAVTHAKYQDIATDRILGRDTAGSGDPEELTLSQVLDFIGSAAQGDILYRGASAWERLPAGTSGNVLQTQGAGANPQWAAGGAGDFVLLTSGTVSSAASLDIVLTSYTAYRGLVFELSNFVPATDDVELRMQVSTDGGSTYDSSAGNYRFSNNLVTEASVGSQGSASNTYIRLAGSTNANDAVSSTASEGGASGLVYLLNQTDTSVYPKTQSHFGFFTAGANGGMQMLVTGHRVNAQDTDAVRFLFESGNIASGKYAVYGLA